MISMGHKATLNTTMLTGSEGFLNPVAALRAVLRSELRGHFPNSPAGAFSLVGEYCYESVPSCITDRLRKVVVFDHPFDVQIFDRNFVKLSDDSIRGFVGKVTTLVDDLLMRPSKHPNSLAPIHATQFPFAYLTLCDFQSSLRQSKILRVVDYLACRERSQVLDSDVDSNTVAGAREPGALIFLDRQNRKPTISLSLDRNPFNSPFDWPRQAQPDSAELREHKSVALQFESLPPISKRTILVLPFETWKSRFLTIPASPKERIVGVMNAAKRICANRRIKPAYVWSFFPNVFQLMVLIEVADRLATNTPCLPAFLEGCIIKLSTQIKHLLELSDDASRWPANFEFVDLQCSTNYNTGIPKKETEG